MKVNYPHYVCNKCGLEANRRTCLKNYRALPKQPKSLLSTYHAGKCEWCGDRAQITEARDFFYPDFKLLERGALIKLKAAWIKEALENIDNLIFKKK